MTMNTYIDCYQYLRTPTGQDSATLVGNLARLSSATAASATSIPVSPATTVALNPYDQVTVFDGSSSEVAIVSTVTNQGATSIPVHALQFAHAQGTALCSDGTQGSLAAMIVEASAQIEEYCRQPLLQATYSSETLPLRTMRAAVTRDYALMLRPKHFPVVSVSAVTAQLAGQTTLSLNIANAQIDSDAQLVTLLTMTAASGGATTFWGNTSPPIRQTTPGFVTLSYTAGYAYTALPQGIRQACTWLTSDLLSDRQNPTGAAELKLGSLSLVTRLRGETTGRSVLVMRAEKAMEPYRQRVF